MGNPAMLCLFIKADRIVASIDLATRSDQEAIERSKLLFDKQRHAYDTFEVWEPRRMVYQHTPPKTEAEPAGTKIPAPVPEPPEVYKP
jgi:hypothetical protein